MDLWISISIGIVFFVLGFFLSNYFPGYFNKKGNNKADFEDSESLTRVSENVKLEFAKEFEFFKKSFESKFLEITIHSEVFMKSYEYSLKQVLLLDEKVSEGFWIYLDRNKLQDSNEIIKARNKLLELRRLIFNSVSIVDGDVISKALDLSIIYDTLFEKKEDEIYKNLANNNYYQELSNSMSTKLDIFKKAIEQKYKFSSGEKFLENLNKIKDVFNKIPV